MTPHDQEIRLFASLAANYPGLATWLEQELGKEHANLTTKVSQHEIYRHQGSAACLKRMLDLLNQAPHVLHRR